MTLPKELPLFHELNENWVDWVVPEITDFEEVIPLFKTVDRLVGIIFFDSSGSIKGVDNGVSCLK